MVFRVGISFRTHWVYEMAVIWLKRFLVSSCLAGKRLWMTSFRAECAVGIDSPRSTSLLGPVMTSAVRVHPRRRSATLRPNLRLQGLSCHESPAGLDVSANTGGLVCLKAWDTTLLIYAGHRHGIGTLALEVTGDEGDSPKEGWSEPVASLIGGSLGSWFCLIV